MLMHTVYWYDTYIIYIHIYIYIYFFYKIKFFEENKINLRKKIIPKTEYNRR